MHRSDLHMSPNCRNICISLPLHTPTQNSFFSPFKPLLQKTLNVVPSTMTFMCFTLLHLSLNVLLTLNAGNNLLSFTSHPGWMNHAESLRVHFNISKYSDMNAADNFKVWSVLQTLNMLFLTKRVLARGDYKDRCYRGLQESN